MTEYKIEEHFSNIGDRNEVRMRVVNKLSAEIPGDGKDNLASRYTYFVENLNNKRVYLRRPANLHKGFDFLVCVDKVNFNPTGRFRNFPKHNEIIADLKNKKIENPIDYKILIEHIEKIYNCTSDIEKDLLTKLKFKNGLEPDLIAAILKWLFIEQDIRRWNYSGRTMLWKGISSI